MDLYALVAPLAEISAWVLLLGLGVPGLIWLLGLIIALRGTAPPERARIIDAYGRAFPGTRGRPTQHSARRASDYSR